MRQPATAHVSTLGDYLQVARRRKWIIVQAVVLVPLAALAFSINQPAQYQGSAQVLLAQQDLANQLTGTPTYSNAPADRVAQTQASIARIPAVAQSAIDATHIHMSAAQFLGSSSVTPTTNSDLLTFAFTHHDAHFAQLLATAYARAYVRYRLASDTAPINNALHEVESQIATLNTHGALYNTLEDKATQLRTLAALKTANASLIRPSQTAVQTAPRTKRNVILGLILGLFLGVGLAFLREALDTRIRTAETIGELLHLPLLARLPAPPKKIRTEDHLVMIDEPSGFQAEAFRMLRTNFEFAALGKEVRTLMVTSATEQEGKSTTLANLAIALARAGQHVVLVDLDLRRPYLDRFFGLSGQPGLTQVAIGAVPLGKAVVRIPVSADDTMLLHSNGHRAGGGKPPGALDVLPSGPIPPDPGDFVGTARLTEILEHLKEHCDIVLIDAPPLFHVGDGLTLSAKVDAVMVVTRIDAIRRPMLAELKRQLDTMPTIKLGFVVTGAESEESYAYTYGDYYERPYERPQVARRA
jgi:succinoglycan biosynthesis transport protein ExoP